ncbi:hypothetical protein LRQ04_06090 [Paenarthrobacter sp. AR 02]|uniref:hypothetical protein n=1 Tax=Paenarthrobacter sp. AR 02 TaxID=2899821 RepID=UPI001F2DA664|nr:hypothetical protein [Paenarthrobacter sp. AR 02]MCF3138824.1 hypothetical protein [Paenarthrobacter sp. AR 02]
MKMTVRSPRTPSTGRLARTAAATVALCILGGAGSAYAYWGRIGIGAGSATNGTMQTVIVDALIAGDTPQNTLIPGGTADVIIRATNPNAHAVTLYGLAANGAITADAGHSGCTTTGVTFTPPSVPLTPPVTVQPNSSILLTLPGAASMSTASLSACQGAQFRIPVTLEARK